MMEKSLSERMAQFDENYPLILEEIARAARLSGRKPEDITLLAATKTVPLEVINHAISRGLSCLGENRVQELLDQSSAACADSSAGCRPTKSSTCWGKSAASSLWTA